MAPERHCKLHRGKPIADRIRLATHPLHNGHPEATKGPLRTQRNLAPEGAEHRTGIHAWIITRLPREQDESEEAVEGPVKSLSEIKSKNRRIAVIAGLFLFGALTFVLITDSFVVSIQHIAQTFLEGLLGAGAVFFTIQWIAPVLSEFPEKVTAFNWARQVKLAPVA